jgi:hypothetical protein
MQNIRKINGTVWQQSTKFERFEMCIKFLENLKRRGHLTDLDMDGG